MSFLRFTFECKRTWESLGLTDDAQVRHCDECGRNVHLTHGVEEALAHGRASHCVALVQVGARPGVKTKTVGRFGEDAGFPTVGWLVVSRGEQPRETVALGKETTIGAHAGADIVLPDGGAAERCRVVGSHGGWTLIATEAVMVNDVAGTRFELLDGDRIEIGSVRLVFKSIN